jgi:Putative Flp pilus-assembly TadE/G-like
MLKRKHRQRGQALIYGIFVMVGGLAALFFLFNTGQLTREKTKLVNTADAVAYSAGVLHARTLNFDAYTNRALVANEVIVAQMVSLSSWAQFTATDAHNLPDRFPQCYDMISEGFWPWVGYMAYIATVIPPELLIKCLVFDFVRQDDGSSALEDYLNEIPNILSGVVSAVEFNKTILIQASDHLRHRDVIFMATRDKVMREVADANYANDGSVRVIPRVIPLPDGTFTDDWKGFTEKYERQDRGRFAEVARIAASKDQFTNNRSWNRSALVPDLGSGLRCYWDYLRDMGPSMLSSMASGSLFTAQDIANLRHKEIAGANQVRRRGGTELINFDEWRGEDTQSLYTRDTDYTWYGWPKSCDWNGEDPMAWGMQQAYNNNQNDEIGASYGLSPATNPQASSNASGNSGGGGWGGWGGGGSSSGSSTDWTNYTGLPSFYDLQHDRLNGDADAKKDAALRQLKFSVLLQRDTDQTVTSEGRSEIKNTPTLNNYKAQNARDVMSAIATSEVYFQRPTTDASGMNFVDPPGGSKNNVLSGREEKGSLFNPYWQVRLIETPSGDFTTARLYQGAVSP